MDTIYMSMLIALMVYKVTIIFYAGVSAIQRLMKFRSYQSLITIFGAILIFLSLITVSSANEHAEFQISGAVHFHHTFFLIILPLLTLVTAVLRGFFKGNHQDTSGQVEGEGRQL
jgi:spore germination protein KB